MKFTNLSSRTSVIFITGLMLVACSESPSESEAINQSEQTPVAEMELVQGSVQEQTQATDRWYSSAQVTIGADVFSQNCAVCHGPNAEGTVDDWRQRLDDGSFPPPPLNGSAHAWHHPNAMLLQVINNGGEAYGGNMPAFADVLEEAEKLAAIAYFQNFWTDEIYSQWEQMGGAN